jgi:hypothetical protein
MVQLHVQCGRAEWVDARQTKDYPAEFLQDLVSAFFKKHPSWTNNLDLTRMKEVFGAKEVFEEEDAEENAEQRSEDEPPRTRGEVYRARREEENPVTDSDSDSD